MVRLSALFLCAFVAAMTAIVGGLPHASADGLRGTGDLGIIIERASGRIQIIETTNRTAIASVSGLGDLSHATALFSRDGRYCFVVGRDGGLTKVDLLTATIVKRIIQAGNSIGGAVSADGRMIAVANYTPGGVRIFDTTTLAQIADIPTTFEGVPKQSKVVGLVDAPPNRFVFTLYDAGEIWVADLADPKDPKIKRFTNVGDHPYDGMITPDGRYYAAGLFGEDGVALLDMWNVDKGVRRILNGYGRGAEPLPVYKMPHYKGWAAAGELVFVPPVGRHEVLVVDRRSWQELRRIPVYGQPVFNVARPDGRQVWVNFAYPRNDVVQVIDVPSGKVVHQFRPGHAVLHIEFTARGDQAWLSVRDRDVVEVYDTRTFARIAEIPAEKPSGIFFTSRAHRIGY